MKTGHHSRLTTGVIDYKQLRKVNPESHAGEAGMSGFQPRIPLLGSGTLPEKTSAFRAVELLSQILKLCPGHGILLLHKKA